MWPRGERVPGADSGTCLPVAGRDTLYTSLCIIINALLQVSVSLFEQWEHGSFRSQSKEAVLGLALDG